MAKDNNLVEVYYPDTIEAQPISSEAVEQISPTGYTVLKTTASSDIQSVKNPIVPPKPTPVPVVAREIIGTSLNSQSRKILSTFRFGELGAIKVGKYESGVSGELAITPNGITAINSLGVTTFSIDGTTGNATFLGTVASGSVISAEVSANLITGTIVNAQIATIDWAKITNVAIDTADIVSLNASVITTGTLSGISIAIGSGNSIFKADSNGIYLGHATFGSAPFRVNMSGEVTASDITLTNASIGSGSSYTGNQIDNAYIGSLNADKITTGDLTGITITGVTITGGTIRTASSGSRVEMNQTDNELRVYSGSTKIIQVDEGGMWVRQGNVIGLGGLSAAGQTIQLYENASVSGQLHIDASTKTIISSTLQLNSDLQIFGTMVGSIDMDNNDVTNVARISGSSGNIDFNNSGRIECSTHFDPSGSGSNNLGGSSRYWNDVSYKTLTDRGCLGWFDEGVEMPDGIIYKDTEALLKIKMHPTKKTVYGKPMLDYSSLPKVVYKKAMTHDGRELERDENDDAYVFIDPLNKGVEYTFSDVAKIKDKKVVKRLLKLKAQDGAETTALISIILGAVKELALDVKELKNLKSNK